MQCGRILFTLAPMLAVAAASAASAKELGAWLEGDGSVNGNDLVYNCDLVSKASPARRAHVLARAEALNSCGTNRFSAGTYNVYGLRNGTTQYTTVPNQEIGIPTSCGRPSQHRAYLESHLIDLSNGKETLTQHCAGDPSGCWNSVIGSSSQCSSRCSANIRTANSDTGGTCANRSFSASSIGAD